MYRIAIDRSLCSGFGSCAELAPDAFELGHDGVVAARVAEADGEHVLEAARSCPMGALAVLTQDGEQVA